MENKRKLFIASSTEELRLAERAKTLLNDDFDVTIWNESIWDKSVFKINDNFLNSLLKATLRYDFGLILGTKDDKVKVRNKNKLQPRDNILFELGLFIGRLGTSRCAFLVEEKIGIPSDLQGITMSYFKRNNTESFENGVLSVKRMFLSSPDLDVNFFPSTILAAGYFENFIKPTCRYLINNRGHKFKNKHYNKYKILIFIPKKVAEDINLQIEQLKNKISTENEHFNYEGRPRSISVEVDVDNDTLKIIDFPTNISGINYALSHLMPEDFSKKSSNYKEILDREIRRYIRVLKLLLINNGFDESVEIINDI